MGKFQRYCQPGSSASPIGRELAAAGSRTLDEIKRVAKHTSFRRLGATFRRTEVIETFPNAALAVLVKPEDLPIAARKKSDRYFEHLIERKGRLAIAALAVELNETRNHDRRMALICALIAASYARGEYTAIGNDLEGYHAAASRMAPRVARRLRKVLARVPEAECVSRGDGPEKKQARRPS
jgi:hypothetical protein